MLLTKLRALEPVRSAVRDEDINQQDRNEQHDRLKVPVGADDVGLAQHSLIPLRGEVAAALPSAVGDSLEEEGQVLVDDPADDDERRDETDSDLRSPRAVSFCRIRLPRDAILQDAPGWRSQ